MSKYKKAFSQMLEENEYLFKDFQTLHDSYQKEPDKYQEQFNELGTKVMRVIRRYENALCSRSENSGYGKYSANLSDMFWSEVRMQFPQIDKVQIV